MHTKSAVKKFASLLASLGLLSGLALTSGASPASAAVQYPDAVISLERDFAAASVEIEPSQTIEFLISADIGGSWSGWDSNATSFSMSAFSLGSLPSGVSLIETEYYWTATNTSDPGANCNQMQNPTTDASKVNFTLTAACKNDMNRVFGEIRYTLTNSSVSTKTVDSNAETAKMSSGGTPVSESNVNTWATATVEMTPSGIVMPSNTGTGVEFQFGTLCVASDVANGAELAIVRNFTLDDTETVTFWNGQGSVPSVYLMDYTYQFRDTDTPPDGIPEDTLIVSAENRGFISTSMRFSISGDTIEGRNLKASLDLTLGGVSKLSTSCGGGGIEDTFPVLGTLSGNKAEGKGTLSGLRTLPTGTPNANTFQGSTVGPNGDVFYWGTTAGVASVSRLGPSGNLKVNGVDRLIQTIGEDEMLSRFAWYGAKSDKYVMIVTPIEPTSSDGVKLYFGNLNKTGGKSNRTIAANKIHGTSGVCGTADLLGSIFVISAPTAVPVVSVNCQPEMMMGPEALRFNMFGTLTASGIAPLGNPKATEDKPCQYVAVGVNRNAKGTQNAFLIYTALGKKTEESVMGGMTNLICAGKLGSDRSFITVTSAGKSKKTNLSTGAFGATESWRTSIGPGKTPNTWLAFGYTGGFTAPPTFGKAYTIDNKLKVKALTKTPTVTATGGFSASGMGTEDTISPIGVLKNGQWLIYREQRQSGMSRTYRIAIAKFNPSTGAVTSGESLSVGGYSYGNKYITALGLSTKGVLSFYALTEAGKYKVATWKSYSK